MFESHLSQIRVHDAMHPGIFSCPPDAPLGEVAGIMAKHRVHAVAVTDREGTSPVGVVSDLDVVAAAVNGGDSSALQAAGTEVLSVSANDRLDHAAQLMAEHGISHLVVVDAASGAPTGILSTLDIADVYAAAP